MTARTRTWSLRIPPSPEAPIVQDANGRLVATLHGPRDQAARDAVLLAHAPAMLDALRYCAEAFQIIAEHDGGPSGQVATSVSAQLDQLLGGPISTWADGPRT